MDLRKTADHGRLMFYLMAINDYWFSLFYEIRAFYENRLSMEKDLHSEFLE